MTLLNKLSAGCLGLLLLATSSCQSSTPQQKPSTTPKSKKTGCDNELRLLEEEVTYESHIKKIFKDKCISCHAGSQAPDLRTYDKFKDDVDSIFSEVDNDKMPQAEPLDDDDKELFQLWKDNNFAEGKATEDEDEDEEKETEDDKDDKDEDEDEDEEDC